MSYILDVLKKSQAEQNPDAIAVSMDQRSTRPDRRVLILLVVVSVLLVINVAFFGYQYLQSEDETMEPVETANRVIARPAPREPAVTQPVAPEQQPQPVVQQPEAVITPEPQHRSRPAVIERVAVQELSANEQLPYNSLNFTSHIYTDDPRDCAIVVDGFRLTVGDAFKGLKVVEITEDGVVFGERRGDQERHVVISILDRWANE